MLNLSFFIDQIKFTVKMANININPLIFFELKSELFIIRKYNCLFIFNYLKIYKFMCENKNYKIILKKRILFIQFD